MCVLLTQALVDCSPGLRGRNYKMHHRQNTVIIAKQTSACVKIAHSVNTTHSVYLIYTGIVIAHAVIRPQNNMNK